MSRVGEVLQGRGTLGQGAFATFGVVLTIAKFCLDYTVSSVFHHPWGITSYWMQSFMFARSPSEPGQLNYLIAMLALALPFIWAGVAMTLARLRDAALPAWLVVFFFPPFINVLFFVFLCCVPGKPQGTPHLWAASEHGRLLDRVIPQSGPASAFMGLTLTLALSLLIVLLSTNVLGNYGWGLFIGMPFTMGFASVLIYTYHAPRTLRASLGVALLSPCLLGLGLLAYAIEGLICLVMAAPIMLSLAALGGALAFSLQRWHRESGTASAVLGALVLALPAGMLVEHRVALQPPTFEVTSSVIVDAPPEVVWPSVIAFAELPPPTELLFRAGVAYPIRAEITGTGPGAIRNCIFSTGPFVEPIEVWDAPRLLKFSVTSNPAPLAEWTPYERVTPPHLRGFLASNGGQFRLTPLAGGRTLLEGTTWYRHTMWPAAYWRLWSDHIIHQIHLRVLRYIAARSVTPAR